MTIYDKGGYRSQGANLHLTPGLITTKILNPPLYCTLYEDFTDVQVVFSQADDALVGLRGRRHIRQ